MSSFKLRGVGPQIAKHLARLDIHSARDLLLHFPLRYQDRTKITPIRHARPEQDVVIEGDVTAVSMPMGGRTKLLCELQDDTGKITLRFFHLMPYQKEAFKVGVRLRCYQQVRLGPKGLEMMHPEFKVIEPEKPLPIELHLTPFYPATEGLSQYMLRKLTSNALEWMSSANTLNELLPKELLSEFNLPTVKEAIAFIHRPPSVTPMEDLINYKTPAQKRLAFEELLAHRLSLLHGKKIFQAQKALSLAESGKLTEQFLYNMPFKLTNAQQRVVSEIQQDVSRTYPMMRLVQGDVGSGKTVVAALAMLRAIESNCQAALMAPTELLAEQHYRVFSKWFEPLGVKVAFLSGQTKAKERAAVLAAIASGEAQIILGTHALFQENVAFAQLALVVVDEQHRFGVHQRALFREKGKAAGFYPHQLIMTATPIPRTLAMSFYADMDCSVIDELPPGRTPVVTTVIANTRRDEIVARIHDACKQGRQVYWVCPLIEESEIIPSEAAVKTHEALQSALPELKIGLIHGRLKAAEKEAVMQAYQRGETQLLVATTVIEVGVDVPNASLMVIENAERLGLAQLHQLRGRVGRGAVASHTVLLYQSPLSFHAKERLSVMRDTTDGFRIAQRDLEIRGPGEVFGTRQTGELTFAAADLIRDSDLLPQVQHVADNIMENHPHLIDPLLTRWLGQSKEYGKI